MKMFSKTGSKARSASSIASLAGQRFVESLESRQLLSAALDLIGVTAMRADATYAGVDGSGVAVAVIDTGVDGTHPALSGNYVYGYDFVTSSEQVTLAGDHGTHVAGIVGSTDPNIGVASGVDLIGLQVFEQSGGAQNSTIERALRWVIDNYQHYKIVAVNMSLGGGFYDSSTINEARNSIIYDEIQTLERAGVTVVSAAGNSYAIEQSQEGARLSRAQGTNLTGSPGLISTLNVGAVWEANDGAFGPIRDQNNNQLYQDKTTAADRIASFSQRGDQALGNVIFAPGALIYSTIPGGRYEDMPGTSMASPMVAGGVALMQDAAITFGGRQLTPIEVRNILLQTADSVVDGDDESSDIVQTYTNQTYKRMDVYAAVQAVRAMFVSGGGGGGGGGGTAIDNNGTFAGASQVPDVGPDLWASLQAAIGADGSSALGAKDVDMFRVTYGSSGSASVKIEPSDPNKTVVIRVWNEQGTELAGMSGLGVQTLSGEIDAGTYYIGISGGPNTTYNPTIAGSGVDGDTFDYQFAISFTSDDWSDQIGSATRVDLGNATGGAQLIGQSIGSDGEVLADPYADVDLYEVRVPDSGFLYIDIDTPYTEYPDTIIRLFDETGAEIGYSLGFDDADAYELFGPYSSRAVELSDGPTEITYQLLYDSQGNMTVGAAIGHITDSFVAGGVTRGDVFYIGVSAYGNDVYDVASGEGAVQGSSSGSYDLHVSFVSNDQNGSINQAWDVTGFALSSTPQTLTGVIGGDSRLQPPNDFVDIGDRDVDFIRFVPSSNGVLDVDIDSYSIAEMGGDGHIAENNWVDTVLSVWTRDGQLLGTIDDVDGPDPSFQMEVLAGIEYFVSVSGYGNDTFDPFLLGSGGSGDIGNYYLTATLRASAVVDEVADDRSGQPTNPNLILGAVNYGNIGRDGELFRPSSDVDVHAFTPAASGNYVFESQSDNFASRNSGRGTNGNLRVFNAAGQELGNSSNGSVTLALQSGQTYYVGVNGYSTQANDYNVVLGGGAAPGFQGNYALSVNAQAENQVPAIGTIAASASTISTNGAVTFNVGGISDADSDPVTISFFRDANNNSVLDGADVSLGNVVAAGATAASAAISGTVLGEGTHRVFAYAGDGIANSAAISTTVSVRARSALRPGGQADGISLVGTSVQVVSENAEGVASVIQGQPGSAWTARELQSIVGTLATVTGKPVTWKASGSEYGTFVAAATSTGDVVVLRLDSLGNWHTTLVTLAASDKLNTESELTVVTHKVVGWDPVNGPPPPTFNTNYLVTTYILGRRANSELVLVKGEIVNNADQWSGSNLSTGDLASQGLQTPPFVGSIVGYSTSWNGMNFAGLDANGDVHTVWWAPDRTKWYTNNLSDITGAPALAGGLTAYVTGWDAVNIVGTDSTGEVLTTWWLPSFINGAWRTDSLTAASGGPKIIASTITSYVTPWNGTNVAGIDATGKTIVYWWAPDRGSAWTSSALSDVIPNATPMAGPVKGFSNESAINLVGGASGSGDVVLYSWKLSTLEWSSTNISDVVTFN